MQIKRIKSILKKLHKDLASTENIDPELKTLLGDLDRDIHKLLTQGAQSRAEAADLVTRAESLATGFAVRHPRSGKIIRELIDTLGKIGV